MNKSEFSLKLAKELETIVADENTRVTKELLDSEKPSRIVNSCRGRDHIDYGECARRGVKVIEVDYRPEESVADHSVAALLWLVVLDKKQAGGEGEELAGKQALIVGAGRIGRAIASRLSGFGVEARYYDPYAGGHFIDLCVGLEWCDYCFLACPLTEETKWLLGYQEFLKLKGKVLINIARNELADPYYLGMAAKDWGLRVAWDFSDELYASDWKTWSTLLGCRALLTKHNAYLTKEAKARRETVVKEELLRLG